MLSQFQPAWRLLVELVESARLMRVKLHDICQALLQRPPMKFEVSDIPRSSKSMNEKLSSFKATDQNRQSVLSRLEKLIDNAIVTFMSDSVKWLLEKLYDELEYEEKNLQKEGDWLRMSFRQLYLKETLKENNFEKYQSKPQLVGPVGERPIHVCALLAAQYRCGGDITIAEGIIRGIALFLGDKKYEHIAWEKYGKDYCAAAAFLLQSQNENQNSLPLLKILKKWCDDRHKSDLTQDLGSKDDHTSAIVLRGLYEGETIIFPFVASNDEGSIRWILSRSLENRSTGADRSLHAVCGSFFRPVYKSWLTSFSVIEGWEWYGHCRGRGNNRFASSQTTYFGLDILFFAAR